MRLPVLWIITLLAPVGLGAQELPRWTATRDLFIDGGRESFAPIEFVVADREGRMYVGQRGANPVTLYAADGARLWRTGRSGRDVGGGEIDTLSSAGLLGDTLWVFDRSSTAITLFAAHGGVARTAWVPGHTAFNLRGIGRRPESWARMPGKTDFVWGILPDGRLLLDLTLADSLGAKSAAAFATARADGRDVRLVARNPAPVLLGSVAVRRPSLRSDLFLYAAFPAQYFQYPQRALSIDAGYLAFADAIVTGPEKRYIIVTMLRAATGDTVYARRYPASMLPIPRDELERAFAATVAAQTNREVAVALRALPKPEFYPPLYQILIGRDGALMVLFTTDTDERDAMVIAPDGTPLFRFRIPSGISVRQFDGQTIWGTVGRTDDSQSIVRYRLRPAG